MIALFWVWLVAEEIWIPRPSDEALVWPLCFDLKLFPTTQVLAPAFAHVTEKRALHPHAPTTRDDPAVLALFLRL